ncbi:MAG: hypothetical protein AVDCRST_MAG23-2835, partial [uncultured Sphingosinicella sp.]
WNSDALPSAPLCWSPSPRRSRPSSKLPLLQPPSMPSSPSWPWKRAFGTRTSPSPPTSPASPTARREACRRMSCARAGCGCSTASRSMAHRIKAPASGATSGRPALDRRIQPPPRAC